MTSLGELLKDDYNFETLVVPSLLAVLPVYAWTALLGFSLDAATGAVILGIELLAVPFWLMINVVRDLGRSAAETIYPDGFPTHTHAFLASGRDYQIEQDRARLSDKSGVVLLNSRQEKNNPSRAVMVIDDAINIVKERMRDPVKFKLLRRELKSFGFWRNMYALRTPSLVVSCVLAILSAMDAIWLNLSELSLVSLGVAVVSFCLWYLVPTVARVERAGLRYRKQFYRSISLI